MANGDDATAALGGLGGDIEPGAPTDDGDEQSEVEKILEELSFFGTAQQLGFDLSPSKGDFEKLLRAILTEGEALGGLYDEDIEAIDTQIAAIGEFGPRTSYLLSRKRALKEDRQREQLDFWAGVTPIIDSFRGAFGISAGPAKKAEAPADPLELYFQAVDRMQAEVLGPDPESRFLNVPGVAEAVSTTTPTDFQQFLQGQQKELQARYLADVFQEFGPEVQQFAGELSGLPEYDEASNSYPRLERFLELRDTLGLEQIPTFETFIEEKTPELQSRFKYLRPLSDEETTTAFRNVFGEELGEGGGQVTPFGTFAQRQQEALSTEFSDIIRGQLKEGAALEELPAFEEFLGGQREELERSFKLSSPFVTGRKRPGTLSRPQRVL